MDNLFYNCLRQIHIILEEAPELNMANYDEDEVSELNEAAAKAFILLDDIMDKYELHTKGL